MINDDLKCLVKATDYVAAQDLVRRLIENTSLLESVKPTIERLYREGDLLERRYLVDGILEHLFEVASVKAMFRDWENDPQLSVAFSQAQDWAEPVIQKQTFLTRVAELCVESLRRRGIDAATKAAEVGIDSIAIELKGDDDAEQLILDCDAEVARKFITDTAAQIRLARYAADRNHWKSDENAPWQQWVHLQS